MKVLVLTEYPPSAAGLATQGQLLCRGLSEIGVDVHPVHFESPQEKEWYYRWFQPDVVVGIGFWGHVPHLVLHPQQFGMKCVPWLLADGYVAAHREVDRQELAVDLPPCLFPCILRQDPDWRPRYENYNQPGEYHNGGVWPFLCGFYVAACVAAGRMDLARRRLIALTELVKPWHENEAKWGFNEWIKAQTGQPSGRDWQTWSAAMYLYAAECVEQGRTPYFDEIRGAIGSGAD